MTTFEIVTRVFGIVLALAVSELLKGFARAWRIHHRVEETSGPPVHVGWLVPMLGAFMLLDQVTFWFNFALIGPHVPASLFGFFGFLAVVGAYFALSTFVFPVDVKLWSDFDTYYFNVRTIVIGGLLAVNFIVLAYEMGLMLNGIELGGDEEAGLISFIMTFVTGGLLVALLFVSGRRTSLALLIAAIIATIAGDLPF